ncbi:MAG: arylsulfatase, partial [Desulfuromonadales bacterium]|nr:arylsulfatase [Desulfuromonadales bacterium]
MPITNKARQGIVSLLLILSAVTSYAASSDAGAKPALPNIVFILADDMSYDSVSALNDKIGEMKTPQIDRLAKEGMIFDDGHSASSVCTPTRYGILTGRYCWRTALKKQVLWDYSSPLINDERLTMGEMLQAKGYQTGMVGKWHLGMAWPGKDGKVANRNISVTYRAYGEKGKKRLADCEQNIDWKGKIKTPRAYGFDYYFGVDVPNFAPYCWIENDHMVGTPTIPKPESIYGRDGIMQEGWQLDRILPTLAEKSVEYINEAAPKDKPYFLYLSLTSPHTPIAPSVAFRGKSGISVYADFVLETDWAVGQVLDAVEASGEADNTLIVFSTDNGTSSKCNFKELKSKGVDLQNHFRGHKWHIYEGGHRVPLLVKWPRQIK